MMNLEECGGNDRDVFYGTVPAFAWRN